MPRPGYPLFIETWPSQHMPRAWFRALDDEPREPCTLVKNFIARQGIILIAGIIFLTWTAIRVKLRYERRNLKTFAADCSKHPPTRPVPW